MALAAVLAAPAAAQESRAERAQQAQILAEAGGAYEGPQADYVSTIGARMAAVAGLRGRCVFTVVDNPVVNAFAAPPGCHIYVTRGLLAVMNSEAELAAVLGHEVGHVAANHSARQESQEALSGLAAALVGAVTKSDLVGDVAGRVAKLSSLGYSRKQEYEADNLSLHYLPLAGYAPEGLSAVLADIEREDQFSARNGGGGRSLPVWASTHPLTTDRVRRAQTQALALPSSEPLEVNPRAFLTAIDGMAYGDQTGRGVIEGRSFLDPRLRIAFDAPEGFRLSPATDAISIQGPDGMRGEFAAGSVAAAGLEAYAARVMASVTGRTPVTLDPAERRVIHGVDAVSLTAHAVTRQGPTAATVVAFAAGEGRAYHFATIGPEDRATAFEPMYGSFRRVSDREASGPGQRRIRVVTVREGDTIESLAARMAGDAPMDRFLMLNGLQPGETPAPGRLVKLVTDGAR